MYKNLRILAAAALSLTSLPLSAATAPYSEDFESYAVGDTAVTNFTELGTSDWTIVSPSYSGQAYQDAISVFSSGPGFVVGQNSSSTINFPTLSATAFEISTTFRIDSFSITGSDAANTGTIGLVARSADAVPASSNADRYQVSYFLDDDGLGHGTGKLWLREANLFFGDSLNTLSTSALAITLGDIYTLILSGVPSGGSLLVSATLTDNTSSASISVSATDSANVLSGNNFGYFNHVRVKDGGTVALNADFDQFNVIPVPGAAWLMVSGLGLLSTLRRRAGNDRKHIQLR